MGNRQHARLEKRRLSSGQYTSKIIKAGALLADAKTLLAHWDLGSTPKENLNRIRHENLFGKASRSRVEDILAIFRQRYVAEESVTKALVALVRGKFPATALDRILYFYSARADQLLHDVVTEILVPMREKGLVDISVQEFQRSLAKWLAELMYTVLLRELGYAEDFDVAELEIELEAEGKLPEFIATCKSELKKDWETVRAGAQKLSRASAILHKLDPTTYPSADSWAHSGLPAPGTEGIFGNMAFSHELVHHIGGQADTNRNTTQRVLMLLEATSLTTAPDDIGAYERTVRQILNRYLKSDSNFHSQNDDESRIPRFLLNDIVRYWRTMCVDFAYKDWEQAGKKWAIRNIKLRTSRKLLFVAGLLMVFSCYKNESLRRDGEGPEDYLLKLQKHLLSFVHSTPLNILVWALRDVELDEHCMEFLNIYEEFLSQINDTTVRDHLGSLNEGVVYNDGIFLRCREISHRLQATLKRVCFEIDTPLREFTCEYGVF